MRLKYLIGYIESGQSINSSQAPAAPGRLGVLKTSSVSKYYFNPAENKEINSDEEYKATCSVKKDTIIVSRGYVSQDYPNLFVPDKLWQVHFKPGIYAKYIWYYLCSNSVKNYYASLATGASSSMQNITLSQLGNVLVRLPSLDDQKRITAFLDDKCAQIDSIISQKKALIEDLQSYRKSLIYEVVTGKRKVV